MAATMTPLPRRGRKSPPVQPDLVVSTLPVAALGSVFLGAHDLRDVVIRTGVDEHTRGSLAATASAFRTAREPWCSSFF